MPFLFLRNVVSPFVQPKRSSGVVTLAILVISYLPHHLLFLNIHCHSSQKSRVSSKRKIVDRAGRAGASLFVFCVGPQSGGRVQKGSHRCPTAWIPKGECQECQGTLERSQKQSLHERATHILESLGSFF